MPTYSLPGNNPVVASGYAPGDKSHDGFLLKKMSEAIYGHLEEAGEELMPWEDSPYRYAIVYDTEPDSNGLHSWKLFEIKDPAAINVTASSHDGVTVLLCKKDSGVVVMTSPRFGPLEKQLARPKAARLGEVW